MNSYVSMHYAVEYLDPDGRRQVETFTDRDKANARRLKLAREGQATRFVVLHRTDETHR